MPRACTRCGRVVAEATYCPFCFAPTLEYIPLQEEEVNTPLKEEESEPSLLRRFWTKYRWQLQFLVTVLLFAIFLWQQAGLREQRMKIDQNQAKIDEMLKEVKQLQKELEQRMRDAHPVQ